MIELPAGIALSDAVPSLMDFGGVMRPPLGGETLKINRLGSRFKIACTLPPIKMEPLGRVVVSRLIQAKREGLRIALPLEGVNQAGTSLPAVNGGGQSGLSLNIRGVSTGYVFKEGFWISIEDVPGGRHHLHVVTANSAPAPVSGVVTIAIEPMLRVSFLDNAYIYVVQPMIEGVVDGDEWAWRTSLSRHVGIEFTIEETA